MSFLLAWHPNTEKTCTSTEDWKQCCSRRHSCPQWESAPGHLGPVPLTLTSLVTASKLLKPNPAACKAGTLWHALLALGAMTNFTAGMLEKPSMKEQILCFFGRRVYLAVASSWCHCSDCNALWGICMISTPQVPCWSHRQKLGYFTPNKRGHLPHALWLPLDACDTIKISLLPWWSSWNRNIVPIHPLKVLGLSLLTHPWHI